MGQMNDGQTQRKKQFRNDVFKMAACFCVGWGWSSLYPGVLRRIPSLGIKLTSYASVNSLQAPGIYPCLLLQCGAWCHTWLLLRCWGSELKSLCLLGKHFTCWAMAPSLYDNLTQCSCFGTEEKHSCGQLPVCLDTSNSILCLFQA